MVLEELTENREVNRREFLKLAGVSSGALATAGLFTHRGYGQDGLPEKIVIGWTPPDITGVFLTATNFFERSAKEAREHGVPVFINYKAVPEHTAFGSAVSIIENFITMGVDAIAISPIEPKVVTPALKKAIEAGIPVVVVNLLEPIEGVDASSYIGFDNRVAGRVSGYALLDYLGAPGVLGENKTIEPPPASKFLMEEWWLNEVYKDIDFKDLDIKAKVAEIEGIAGGFFANLRHQGFWDDVVSKVPGIELVGRLAADWNREKGTRAAEDILTANPPGELDAIYAQSNEMGIGAMNAVEAAGRLETVKDWPDDSPKGPEVAVFTNDGTPESLGYIREGRLVAETWHGFPEWGWFGTPMAVRAALGLDTKYIFDIRPRTEYIGNADQFYPGVTTNPEKRLDAGLYGYDPKWGSWEAIKEEAKQKA